MTITAKVICDSSSDSCRRRITTMELKYPRFIHSEFMTHRVFSRNASSSRAIPVARQIEMIKEDPAMPIHWGKNQPGMQAKEENTALVDMSWRDDCAAYECDAESAWLTAMDYAISVATALNNAGYHKQIVNRILEPFTHIKVIVTATDFANFFALRDHPDAQPEIRELARVMKGAMTASTPQVLKEGDWHLPYLDAEDLSNIYEYLKKGRIIRDEPSGVDTRMMACAISAARCARVSYLTHDGERPTIEKDMELYHHLVHANPPHMSPCEHQASPDKWSPGLADWARADQHGNFTGWIQFRHLIKGESVYG